MKVSVTQGVYRVTIPKRMAEKIGLSNGGHVKIKMADDSKEIRITKVD